MNQLKRGRLLPLVAAAILALVTGVSGPRQAAYAQAEGGVTLSAEAGFDGFCKENAWIPVRVTVANNGPDIKGRVQISYKRSGDPSEALLGEDLLIPTTSRKQVVLYAYPPQGSYSMIVRLVVNGKAIVSSKLSRGCLAADNMLFGILADRPGVYDALRDIPLVRGRSSVAHLQISDLPSRAQGWSALDGLIVSNIDTSALTEAQRDAMQLWLANGGKLMIIGGPQWQGTAAGLKDVLPVDIASTENVSDLTALSGYFQASTLTGPAIPAARATAHAGADVLVSQDGLPLIVQEPVGFGRVIYFALDPALDPLQTWGGMRIFYAQLLGMHAVQPEWTNMPWVQDASNRALSALPELGLPSAVYVCGWLLLYIVIIGPVNFLILRRRKRREWAWFSVPALVIVFTAGSYLYGGVYRGNQPILNRLAVVQAWEGVPQAQVHALVGVYSPGRSTYTVQANEPFQPYPFTNGTASLLQDGQSVSMQDVRVEIGGMKALTAEGSVQALPISHSLVLSVGDHYPLLEGSVTNNSSYALHDAMLVTSGDWQELGDLQPGASMRVHVSLTPASNGPMFYTLRPEEILHVNSFPLGPRPTGNATDEQSRRLGLLSAVLRSSSDGNWGVYLMGWTDRPMVPVSVKGRTFRAVDTSLYVEQLNPSVRYDGSPLRLTPGLMAWEASDVQRSPYSTNSYGSTDYTLSFHPAFPVHYTSVADLAVQVGSPGNGTLANPVDVSLWDFENGQWVKLDKLSWFAATPVSEPALYVGPGGEVRMRVAGQNNNYINITQSTVTLVVNR